MNFKPIKKIAFRLIIILLILMVLGYLIPSKVVSPIAISDVTDIDAASFWYYPWGKSIVHKGIDIFCDSGTNIIAPATGMVISKGYGSISGNYVYILGAKWRTYYFAHMDTCFVSTTNFVTKGTVIGKVGNTGNAKNKPTHLHYAIQTIIPYFWLYDAKAIQGWKKMFYLNPDVYLNFEKEY